LVLYMCWSFWPTNGRCTSGDSNIRSFGHWAEILDVKANAIWEANENFLLFYLLT